MVSHNARRPAPPNRSAAHNGKRDALQATANDLYRVQVIDRAAGILDCFAFDKPELSVGQVSAATGLHKSTAHRILMALERNGFVEQNPESSKYHLGIKLFKLGHQAVARLNLRDIARPHLRALMEQTGETVHLAVLDSAQVLYLEKVEGPHALRMPSRVGRHIPPYCTSLGKAMLAYLTEKEIRRILQGQPITRYTPNTVKNVEGLLAELKRTRRRGYSIDDEEIEVGLRCVGAPVLDYTGDLVGAISVAGPSARLVREKIPLIGNIVMKVADAISQQLGFEAPGQFDEARGKEEFSLGRSK